LIVGKLKKPDEARQRDVIRSVEPLPKIFNVLYRHNPNFTGRFEALDSLQKTLTEGNAAITALQGLGGVGKTTLAAEYCIASAAAMAACGGSVPNRNQ
jgi:ABC-type glutathione transport system ATPase component